MSLRGGLLPHTDVWSGEYVGVTFVAHMCLISSTRIVVPAAWATLECENAAMTLSELTPPASACSSYTLLVLG